MIIVGLMVGGIFGLITVVGAQMVGGGTGLGNRLVYFSSLGRMDSFFAVILIVAALGISLYAIAYWMNRRWASWKM
jgi:NitT/TauT family transport system permease protein